MTQTCVAPDEISSWELQAYVDGENIPAVAKHLGRCPACAETARSLMRWERDLEVALHRFDCPSPDTLLSYFWHRLSGDEEQAVAEHLAVCLPCQNELAALARVGAPMSADATILPGLPPTDARSGAGTHPGSDR